MALSVQRVPRRTFVSGLLAVVASAGLAGCASQPAPSTAPTAAPGAASAPAVAPKAPVKAGPTGRMIWGTEAPSFKTANPGMAANAQPGEYFWPSFDGLIWVDSTGKLRPGVAKEWKSVDPRTWEFTIRDDLKFHNGTPLEVEDIVGTFEYYRDSKENLRITAMVFMNVESVTAVNKTTLRIVTKNVDPAFPKRVSYAFIQPWREIQKMGMEKYLAAPFGTGPYRWITADFANGLKWEAMPADFVSPRGPATVAQLEMRFIPEVATRMAALRTGEIDIAERLAGDAADALKAEGFPLAIDAGTAATSFLLDPFEGPTRDVRVRQAINYAVDKQAILKTIFGSYGEVDAQLIGKEVLGHNPELSPYPYDPERAKQLLAEAGHANGFTLPMWASLSVYAGKELAEAVGSYLQRVGITTNLTVLETAVWVANRFGAADKRRGIFANIVSWDYSFEADGSWNQFSKTSTPAERGGAWDDETFDRQFQLAVKETDETKRAKLYQDAAKILHDRAPVLFLFRYQRLASTAKNVKWEAGWFADMYTTKISRLS